MTIRIFEKERYSWNWNS